KLTPVVEIDASDDIEPCTLDMVEFPDEEAADSGEKAFSVTATSLTPAVPDESPAATSFVAPERTWKVSPQPGHRRPRVAAGFLGAVLLGTLVAFAWHVYHRMRQPNGEPRVAQGNSPPQEVVPEPAPRVAAPSGLYDLEEPPPASTTDRVAA